MEFALPLIVFALVYLCAPFIAIRMAGKARRRVDEVEEITVRLRQELHALKMQVEKLEKSASRAPGEAATVKPSYGPPPAYPPAPVPAPVAPPRPATPAPVAAKNDTIDTDSATTDSADTAPAPFAPERAAARESISVESLGIRPAVPAPGAVPPPANRHAARAPVPPQPKAPLVKPAWMRDTEDLFGQAKKWLFGGNLVAKLGLLILFIGISFLLKYVSAQVTVPIELRLAAIVLADIALLVWGWRIRERRPGISLPVQGAALAILMLVTFGAFRLYHLIPSSLAFALLLALTAFTCALAVLQNAIWLATFGIVGGFAVPILTSSGGGSHIGLFSYYALLNAGIFAIALKRPWRMLNLLGFLFTFVIGTAWGVLNYAPEHYLSTQLFLILFFLFYVAIAVAYAARSEPKLKHYVDATLVFGTPILAMGLQYGLVKEMRFGLAFSALALGLFYTGLALLLWRRHGKRFRLLAETFVALAVVFGTLALPFALDGRWTSAAWALEGAGIVWVGLRQRRALAWAFGLLVQAGAWLSFLASVSGFDAAAALHENLWLGFLILAAAAFFMATTFRSAQADPDKTWLPKLALPFLAGATLWLLAGAWTEIVLRTAGVVQLNLLTVSALLVATVLGLITRRMAWPVAARFAVVVQAIAGAALLALTWRDGLVPPINLFDGPFLSALLLSAALLLSSWLFARQAAQDAPVAPSRLAHGLLLWAGLGWYGLVLASFAAWIARLHAPAGHGDALPQAWGAAYLIAVAATAPLFCLASRRLAWPALRWLGAPAWVTLALGSANLLAVLYGQESMPDWLAWSGFLCAWLAGEYLLQFWPRAGWTLRTTIVRALHTVRSGAPWLMIWPVGGYWITSSLLRGDSEAQRLLAEAGWDVSGSWARYLPAWLMMLVIAALIRRCRAGADTADTSGNAGGWPVAPVRPWYARVLLPLATLWSVLLVAVWNLAYNGAMAPLPYLPLLNPLDLSTGFALLLAVACYRLQRGALPAPLAQWQGRAPFIAGCVVYAWLNLMLLRSVSQYGGVPYRADAMLASQFVQALLSIVWSVTALLLMRHAARRHARTLWSVGAVLLGFVVLKLFAIDLSNVGGIERIVSFVGVGLLMVLIGYLAPFPGQAAPEPDAASDTDPDAPQPTPPTI